MLAIKPQLISGEEIPIPKKLSVDSANIELGIVKVNVTIKGANIFGRISLKMMCIFPKPFNLADVINGRFFNSKTLDLEILATLIQLSKDKAGVIPNKPFPKIKMNIDINNRSGIE